MIAQLFFHFKGKGEIENSGISIYIEEKKRALRKRQLAENMLSYVGPYIGNSNLNIGRRIRVAIKLEQFIDSEDDVSKNCFNYPTKEYLSYAECDEKYVQLQFKKYWENLKPFWVVDNLSEVTRSILYISVDF